MKYSIILFHYQYNMTCKLHRLSAESLQNPNTSFIYFLSRAGGVKPAESPLSPANVAPESFNSSLEPQSDTKSMGDKEGMDVLDTQQRIILSYTLAPSRCTSLNLAYTKRDSKIRDDGVLSLTTTVRNHHTPAIGLRQLCTI